MTITTWGIAYRGLSSDSKPTGKSDNGWIFLEEDTGKVYIKHNDPMDAYEELWTLINPTVSMSGVVSNPPQGCSKITNIYVDAQGKVQVQFDTGG
jgi:hypothetical protein